jgi:hypothetical protein
MSAHPLILTLDQYGSPHRWVSWQHACVYVARDLVAWDAGEAFFTFVGGISRSTGQRSTLTTSSIIAIRGRALTGKSLLATPPLSNRELFSRDRHICAYCAKELPGQRLTRDHILPVSRGGRDTWMNVVTACQLCPPKRLLVNRVSEYHACKHTNPAEASSSNTYWFGFTSSRRRALQPARGRRAAP